MRNIKLKKIVFEIGYIVYKSWNFILDPIVKLHYFINGWFYKRLIPISKELNDSVNIRNVYMIKNIDDPEYAYSGIGYCNSDLKGFICRNCKEHIKLQVGYKCKCGAIVHSYVKVVLGEDGNYHEEDVVNSISTIGGLENETC